MEENKKRVNGLTIILFVLLLIAVGVICYLLGSNSVKESGNNNDNPTEEKVNNSNDIIQQENIGKLINKRLYSVDSAQKKQRYQLLIDDATYGMDQNFLDKKTYILDLNVVEGNQIIKEVDLAKVFKPFFDNYINENKGTVSGNCRVSYFNAFGHTDMMNIDYEKEIPFIGYYYCVDRNFETSLGNVLYVYNVESNSIRNLGFLY